MASALSLSGEMSLADKIGEDGRGRKETAGQRVRVVEVPTDTGVHGLFENLHDVPDAAQFAKRLAGAAKTYYGAPARAFIAAVSGDLEKTKGFITQGVQAFIDGRKLEGASGQVKRVCERFGIAAAAGELAINLGIVPWPKGEAIKAAAGCFQAWIDARGGIEVAEVTNGIAAVRVFGSAQGSSRFEAAWEEPPRDRDGKQPCAAPDRKPGGLEKARHPRGRRGLGLSYLRRCVARGSGRVQCEVPRPDTRRARISLAGRRWQKLEKRENPEPRAKARLSHFAYATGGGADGGESRGSVTPCA